MSVTISPRNLLGTSRSIISLARRILECQQKLLEDAGISAVLQDKDTKWLMMAMEHRLCIGEASALVMRDKKSLEIVSSFFIQSNLKLSDLIDFICCSFSASIILCATREAREEAPNSLDWEDLKVRFLINISSASTDGQTECNLVNAFKTGKSGPLWVRR